MSFYQQADKNIAVRLLPIKEYNIISYLGRGRFTEVKLYRGKADMKLVVIKETMYRFVRKI